MQLNPKKCKEMIISFLKHNHTCFAPIFISGFPVEVVSTFKLLGIMLSNDLTSSITSSRQLRPEEN